jgi:undecaprenyl diphosphate synthase
MWAITRVIDVSSSSSSWREETLSEGDVSWEDDDVFFPPNASQQCLCPLPCQRCPDLLWKVLRWIKLIALKVGRSYYAIPVTLLVLTLAAGFCGGVLFGRAWEKRIRKAKEKTRALSEGHFGVLSWTEKALMLLAQFSFTLKERFSGRGAAGERTFVADVECRTETADESHANKHPFPQSPAQMQQREELTRQELKSRRETLRESGIPDDQLPKHIAVIMDGNRRYGKQVHGNTFAGHWDGSRKLLEFAKWCLAERIQVLTVYAFSTENWKRDAVEVASLMSLISKHCEELQKEALQKNIQVRILSTDKTHIPERVHTTLQRLEEATRNCKGVLIMNICLSYGGRGEIVRTCRDLAEDSASGKILPNEITEEAFAQRLLTRHCPDPDVLIRTSGEERISNFLLWQLAYKELFFLDKKWPELAKADLLHVLRSYAAGRQRRFGR